MTREEMIAKLACILTEYDLKDEIHGLQPWVADNVASVLAALSSAPPDLQCRGLDQIGNQPARRCQLQAGHKDICQFPAPPVAETPMRKCSICGECPTGDGPIIAPASPVVAPAPVVEGLHRLKALVEEFQSGTPRPVGHLDAYDRGELAGAHGVLRVMLAEIDKEIVALSPRETPDGGGR